MALFLNKWLDLSIRRAGLIVFAALLITILLGIYTVRNISINTDTDQMIDPDLPFRQTYDAFNHVFPQLQDSFLILIDGPTFEETTAATEAYFEAILSQPDHFQNPFAPGLGAFFDRQGLLYLNMGELVALSNRLADAQPVLTALSEDPSLRGLFELLASAAEEGVEGDIAISQLADVFERISLVAEELDHNPRAKLSWTALFDPDSEEKSALRRVIMVQPVLDFTRLQPARTALDLARQMASSIEDQFPGSQVRVTGKMALGADEMKSVSDGAALAGILSLILVTLVLGFGVRSLRLVAASLFTLITGLVWTAAFAIFAIGYFNIISIAFAVLFIGLGIDFAIHFVLRYREEVAAGKTTEQALKDTGVNVGGPLAICAPTTALAFFAFAPTSYAGLAQLGIISGTGMFVSLFTSLTLLPAILTLMPLKSASRAEVKTGQAERGLFARHSRWMTLSGLAIGAMALLLVPKVAFDFDPIRLKDPSSESVEAFMDILEETEKSPYAAQLVAADFAEAQALADRLETLPGVDKVVWLQSFIPDNQAEKFDIIDTTALFLTPVLLGSAPVAPPSAEENTQAINRLISALDDLGDTTADASLGEAGRHLSIRLRAFASDPGAALKLEHALLALFPGAMEKLEKGLFPQKVDRDALPASLRSRYETPAGALRLEIFASQNLADQTLLKDFVETLSEADERITGSPVQIVNAGRIVISSMTQATLGAAILSILFLMIILRSFGLVGLIAAPVVLAAALTAGATVLFDIPFNFANVIVLPLLIGLGVDSGIHLVLRAREERSGTRLLDTSTPRAVLLSALTTIGSFGSLALSSHQGTASMGLLLTVSVLLTLVATLIVLPGLIDWFYAREKSRSF